MSDPIWEKKQNQQKTQQQKIECSKYYFYNMKLPLKT